MRLLLLPEGPSVTFLCLCPFFRQYLTGVKSPLAGQTHSFPLESEGTGVRPRSPTRGFLPSFTHVVSQAQHYVLPPLVPLFSLCAGASQDALSAAGGILFDGCLCRVFHGRTSWLPTARCSVDFSFEAWCVQSVCEPPCFREPSPFQLEIGLVLTCSFAR